MPDKALLRQCFSHFATGVTIVTTHIKDADGQSTSPFGFTANSFTSVSLNPPLLLVAIDHASSGHQIFAKSDHFAVNILAHDQKALANRFATKETDRFHDIEWDNQNELGLPLIKHCSAYFMCRHHQLHRAGDHDLLIGEIVSCCHQRESKPALGYWMSNYVTITP